MSNLRGERYLDAHNVRLAKIIAEELPLLDLDETLALYDDFNKRSPRPRDAALLACNDRFFLLTGFCRRRDAVHPWVFARCREVEASPDGYLDLWARWHYKSTIITFAGVLQETLINPELCVAIFSFTNKIAHGFLRQIKVECETNDKLKAAFPDVLWKDPKVSAPVWSTADGLVFKRKGNPKEPTIGAYGLIDGMPTAMHFGLLNYDDIIEKRHVTNPEMVKKATDAWELSDNLGAASGTRKWHTGTRYLFADTYQAILDRKILTPRIYPATHNGKLEGNPVFMSPKRWAEVKVAQRGTVAAQMLQNPLAGKEAMFEMAWMRGYETRPATLNLYLMGDPSSGRTSKSDRTAYAVIGIDTNNNKYLLDGACHRMKLSERWLMMRQLWLKWHSAMGVQMMRVGYEKYGMQADIEYFEEKMREEEKKKEREKVMFAITELAWPADMSKTSKPDRIGRLQPDFELSKFWLPALAHHEDLGLCWWKTNPELNKFDYTPYREPSKSMKAMTWTQQPYRNCEAIKRLDEDGNIYDVTRRLIEELLFMGMTGSFGSHDDMADTTSRLYDMEPMPAVQLERIVPERIEYADA